MTLLFVDSFDHYDTAHMDEKWMNRGVKHSIVAGTGRRGSQALYWNGPGAGLYTSRVPVSTVKTEYTVGFAIYFSSFAASTTDARYAYLPQFRSTSGVELVLLRDWASGCLEVRRGGTDIIHGTQVIAVDTWYFIEIQYFADNATGTVEVRIDNVVDIDFGPGDTVQVDADIVEIDFGGTGDSEQFYIDDLYICDSLGGVNDDFLGDCRVDALLPDGVGASADWTPSAGANWDCVDEVPPNDDTDYVSEGTVDDHDTYSFDDSPVGTGGVLGVQHCLLARKDDAGVRTIKGMIRSGGTDYEESIVHNLGDDYLYYLEIVEDDPDTASPWIISGVDAAEFGAKLEA